jgi:hypothetical protein
MRRLGRARRARRRYGAVASPRRSLRRGLHAPPALSTATYGASPLARDRHDRRSAGRTGSAIETIGGALEIRSGATTFLVAHDAADAQLRTPTSPKRSTTRAPRRATKSRRRCCRTRSSSRAPTRRPAMRCGGAGKRHDDRRIVAATASAAAAGSIRRRRAGGDRLSDSKPLSRSACERRDGPYVSRTRLHFDRPRRTGPPNYDGSSDRNRPTPTRA